ncbi:MAG TPA: alpha/beta family hydrolase [Burkholderiaceae bacterium]|nr:alpha/beta family hydrolase [Burkholderiaceae bacterium]
MVTRTKSFQFKGPAGIVDCALDWPDTPLIGWALVLHPHPLHGGTRDNKVVTTIARACTDHGLLVVRPNFRGVGSSEGEFDNGVGETNDMEALLQHVQATYPDVAKLPWVLAGFSFGTAVAARLDQRLRNQQSDSLPLTRILVGTAAQRFSADENIQLPADTLLIHGETDEVISLDEVMNFAREQQLPLTVIPDSTHFFHGKLLVLRDLVTQRLAALTFN